MGNILITGVSSGIGEALAALYLKEGSAVYGVSRRTPYFYMEHENFHFKQFDLSSLTNFEELFTGGFSHLLSEGIDVLFLNAGVSGNVPAKCEDFTLEEIQHVLAVNVLANKLLLDIVLSSKHHPRMCVISASMAGLRFRSGTLPYSLSKAALSALAGVYAEENPDVFFAVLGLCNVNTSLSRQVSFSEKTAKFAELKLLQQRALTEGYMVSAAQRAIDICSVISSPSDFMIKSGEFVDIRKILPSTND